MEIDTDKIDDAVLALLHVTRCEDDKFGARAWKSHDWDALSRLHEKGYISNPVGKAKSVVLTAEGEVKAEELFHKLFDKRARDNWAAAFQKMAHHGDDSLLDDVPPSLTGWDEGGWEWR